MELNKVDNQKTSNDDHTPELLTIAAGPSSSMQTHHIKDTELSPCCIIDLSMDDQDSDIDDDQLNSMWAQSSFIAYNVLYYVMKYLKLKDILRMSQVCTSWNSVAHSKSFWHNINLDDITVSNWKQLVDIMVNKDTNTLNTISMRAPTESNVVCNNFWLNFVEEITRAKNLKILYLCECPTFVVDQIMLPQLQMLEATSINNRTMITNLNQFLLLQLVNVDYMVNLTVLNLKGLNEIKINYLPSFENLVKLKFLSLTSIVAFPKNRYTKLASISSTLETLEIGDCECLSVQFVEILQKFINLKRLRLENCYKKWDNFGKRAFSVINMLQNLEMLELINIELSDSIQIGLKMCKVKSLLLVPLYSMQPEITNRHVLDCMLQLKSTSCFHWGISTDKVPNTESMYIIDFIDTDFIRVNDEIKIPILGKLIKTEQNSFRFENDILNDYPLDRLKMYMRELFKKLKVILVPVTDTTKLRLND